jgi:hypothetical protein
MVDTKHGKTRLTIIRILLYSQGVRRSTVDNIKRELEELTNEQSFKRFRVE